MEMRLDMEITAKELRGKPGQIIDQAARGTDIVITIRGKKMARLIPYKAKNGETQFSDGIDEIFGIWADKSESDSVDAYVREKRKRRSF
jgi:prevent-host-death family protein